MKRIVSRAARFALAVIITACVSLLALDVAVASAGPGPIRLHRYAPVHIGPVPTGDMIVAIVATAAVVAGGLMLLVWADRAGSRERQTQAAPVSTLPPDRAAQQGHQQARKAA